VTRRRVTALFAAVALASAGCSTFHPPNVPLERWRPDAGDRSETVAARRPPGKVLLLLAFSGGGTRAAALAYGVLQELRDTSIAVRGERKRLLDEIDAITSVSGGSFTAAYYGLRGERIFEDFEERFLRRDVEAQLVLSVLNPLNWFRMFSSFFDRTDLAVELYEKEIFERATFADLLAAGGPLLEINATDIAAHNHFTFVQRQFDLLCADLSSFPIARAVTASSAVPGLFSPLVLRNYAGTCGYQPPAWLAESLADRRSDPRRFHVASILNGYLDAKQVPYVHLLDGGISDNIGLRVPLENVAVSGGPVARLEQLHVEPPDRVFVIVVNAEVDPPASFELVAEAPGLEDVIGAVSSTQIGEYNFDTIELMRERLTDWAKTLPPASDGRPVQAGLVTLSFGDISDPHERGYFEDVPTSFTLSDETVDRLIAVARSLLREAPEFQELLRDLSPARTP